MYQIWLYSGLTLGPTLGDPFGGLKRSYEVSEIEYGKSYATQAPTSSFIAPAPLLIFYFNLILGIIPGPIIIYKTIISRFS